MSAEWLLPAAEVIWHSLERIRQPFRVSWQAASPPFRCLGLLAGPSENQTRILPSTPPLVPLRRSSPLAGEKARPRGNGQAARRVAFWLQQTSRAASRSGLCQRPVYWKGNPGGPCARESRVWKAGGNPCRFSGLPAICLGVVSLASSGLPSSHGLWGGFLCLGRVRKAWLHCGAQFSAAEGAKGARPE